MQKKYTTTDIDQLNAEFEALNDEAKKLEAQIADNIKRLFQK